MLPRECFRDTGEMYDTVFLNYANESAKCDGVSYRTGTHNVQRHEVNSYETLAHCAILCS